MYKVILMTVCINSTAPINGKDIYVNRDVAVTFAEGKTKESLESCPQPLTEQNVHARIIDGVKTFPIWELTVEQLPSRTFIRVPYYFSSDNPKKEDGVNRWHLVPMSAE